MKLTTMQAADGVMSSKMAYNMEPYAVYIDREEKRERLVMKDWLNPNGTKLKG